MGSSYPAHPLIQFQWQYTKSFRECTIPFKQHPCALTHPQSLQCAPTVCALAVSRVKVIGTPTATAGLFRASSVRFGLSTLGIGFMGGAVAEAWRSVLRRDKGGRLGRDTFRGGSPRRLSNGRKRASAHSMRPAKTRPPKSLLRSPHQHRHALTQSRAPRCVPFTTASALHFALPPLHLCSLQPPLKPARFSR